MTIAVSHGIKLMQIKKRGARMLFKKWIQLYSNLTWHWHQTKSRGMLDHVPLTRISPPQGEEQMQGVLQQQAPEIDDVLLEE